MSNSKKSPAVQQKHIYLTIVSYVGGQLDKSLTPATVLNSSQFLYAYDEDDKGFQFGQFNTEYSTHFEIDNIRKTLGLDIQTPMDEVIGALYNLGDFGFDDSENATGVSKFLKRLTGETIAQSNKADPRGNVFN